MAVTRRAAIGAALAMSAAPFVVRMPAAAQRGGPEWSVAMPAAPTHLGALPDGGLLVACVDGSLICLEQATGATRWSLATGSGAALRPAVGRGFVAVSNEFTDVHAVDSATGNVLWTNPVGQFREISAPAVAGDVVAVILFGGAQNSLVGLDAATGEQRWLSVIGEGLGDPIGVDATLYVSFTGYEPAYPRILAFEPQEGRSIGSSPRSLVALAVGGDRILALEAETGDIAAVDRYMFGTAWSHGMAGVVSGGWSGEPALDGGTALVGTTPGVSGRVASPLVAIDMASGEVRWEHPVEGGVDVGPVVDGGFAWVASYRDPVLAAVDLATGKRAWTMARPGSTPVALAAAAGLLFVADREGVVNAWRPEL